MANHQHSNVWVVLMIGVTSIIAFSIHSYRRRSLCVVMFVCLLYVLLLEHIDSASFFFNDLYVCVWSWIIYRNTMFITFSTARVFVYSSLVVVVDDVLHHSHRRRCSRAFPRSAFSERSKCEAMRDSVFARICVVRHLTRKKTNTHTHTQTLKHTFQWHIYIH